MLTLTDCISLRTAPYKGSLSCVFMGVIAPARGKHWGVGPVNPLIHAWGTQKEEGILSFSLHISLLPVPLVMITQCYDTVSQWWQSYGWNQFHSQEKDWAWHKLQYCPLQGNSIWLSSTIQAKDVQKAFIKGINAIFTVTEHF